MKRPNLCIVTEFVKRGSMKDIICDLTIKLTWPQKMGMLKSAALGINYLHSLSPVLSLFHKHYIPAWLQDSTFV